MARMRTWTRDERVRGLGGRRREAAGQGMVEYALILAFIAILVIVALKFLQPAVSGTLNTVAQNLPPNNVTITLGSGCAPSPQNVMVARNGTVTWHLGTGCGSSFLQVLDPNLSIYANGNVTSTDYAVTFAAAGAYRYNLLPGGNGQITIP